MSGFARRAFERMPDSIRVGVQNKRSEFRGIGKLKDNQRLLTLRLAELESLVDPRARQGDPVPDDRFPDGVRSKLCTQADMQEPWMTEWCAAMGEPLQLHRKHWEFAYIARVLDQLGLVEEGRKGLGFGVGREPLVSAFAAKGVEVLATDLDPEAREAEGWVRSGQHVSDGAAATMLREHVVDRTTFERLVSWAPVDMRAIPDSLQGFDFCWSACSLEHLGTLDLGLEFIENSLRTLKPGGIAVHTTEFNLDSDDETIEAGPTVVYRKRDMLALKARLEEQGHEVAAFDFDRGEGLLDRYVDVPPYAEEPVLRFWFANTTLTSVAIVVRKKA